jgi:hypothetical protein
MSTIDKLLDPGAIPKYELPIRFRYPVLLFFILVLNRAHDQSLSLILDFDPRLTISAITIQ